MQDAGPAEDVPAARDLGGRRRVQADGTRRHLVAHDADLLHQRPVHQGVRVGRVHAVVSALIHHKLATETKIQNT